MASAGRQATRLGRTRGRGGRFRGWFYVRFGCNWLSPAIARELRARGHDAESVAGEPGRVSLSDPEVLALARAEHRALVTTNLRDYRPLPRRDRARGRGHFGMIFMPGSYRGTRSGTGRIITALEAELAQYPGEHDLANGAE